MDSLSLIVEQLEKLTARLASVLAKPGLTTEAMRAAKKVGERLETVADNPRTSDAFETGLIDAALHSIETSASATPTAAESRVITLPINSLVRTDATPAELRAQLRRTFQKIATASQAIGLPKYSWLSPASIAVWDPAQVEAMAAEAARALGRQPPPLPNGPLVTGSVIHGNETVATMGWHLHYPEKPTTTSGTPASPAAKNAPKIQVSQWIMTQGGKTVLPDHEIKAISGKLIEILRQRYKDATWLHAPQASYLPPP